MDYEDYKYLPTLTKRETKLKDKVQNDIHYCLNCQARDSGDWIWVMGHKYELNQLLNDHKVPEKSIDKIVAHLSCPYCGTELNDRYDEIGLEDIGDIMINSHLNEAKKKYGKSINEFHQNIKNYPTLALQSSLAKKIFKEIKDKKLPTCSIEGQWFRARTLSDSKVLTAKDFLAPPIGKPQEGRFNHSGQSHFYIADSEETSIAECLPENKPSLLWMQEFEINKIENILDLSYDWNNLGPSTSTLLVALHDSKILEQSEENKEMWKPEYNITRFIMDSAKQNGFVGIKYNSVKSICGNNVVLFNFKKEIIKKYGKPRVIEHNPISIEREFSTPVQSGLVDLFGNLENDSLPFDINP